MDLSNIGREFVFEIGAQVEIEVNLKKKFTL